jgi:Arc/MetJ-type ribon-helix-helix transcriptional regulator
MATEMITVKMDNRFLEEVDSAVEKGHYQNRTEFIRSALRDKLEDIQYQEYRSNIMRIQGRNPRHVSQEEYEKARENTFKEIEHETPSQRKKRLMEFHTFIDNLKGKKLRSRK